jgi:hypothetical protein
MGRVFLTKLGDGRLRSVDRNNKATLLLTRRYRTIKSYAKVLSPRIVKLKFASWHYGLSPQHNYKQSKIQGRSLFVSDYDVWEEIIAFWHGF